MGAAIIFGKSLGVVMMFCLELCLSRLSLGSLLYHSHDSLLFLRMFPLRSYKNRLRLVNVKLYNGLNLSVISLLR
jgi:hypothetical protein